jgi:DNA-binding transcriptional regulator YhcF (GntR family)
MYEFEMIYRDQVSEHAVSVYRYLVDRAGLKGYCWPSINRICTDLKYCRTTVKKALRELEQTGYLETVPQRRADGSTTSSRYYPKVPKN